MRRIVSESSTLGWRVLGRDRSGCLVAHTVLGCGHDTGVERHCLLTFTRRGLVHESTRFPVRLNQGNLPMSGQPKGLTA